MATSWTRGVDQQEIVAADDQETIFTPLVTWDSTPVTVRRIILDWDLHLAGPVDQYPTSYTVPAGLGLIVTSSSSGTPPTPSDGPLTSPGDAWKWTEGIAWRPIYYNGSQLLDGGASGRIDRNGSDFLIPGTSNNTLWLCTEVYNNPTALDYVQLVTEWQVLTSPTGS